MTPLTLEFVTSCDQEKRDIHDSIKIGGMRLDAIL